MISSHSQIVRPPFVVLVRYVGGLLEASSARFDRVTSPDRPTSPSQNHL
ncbi:hypothetical protein ACVINU_008058 [Bradyrhizobium diazoefficiens]